MTFDTLGLAPTLLKAVAEEGYTDPTPIQAQAVPAILDGQDVMAAAQTGTGKTAGFTLPLLQRLDATERPRSPAPRALILTPTRELAAQVQESVATYGKHLKLRSLVVFGGVNINPQIDKLKRGVDILVATPGRLLDLHQQKAVRLDQVETFILDEADRMLDMGFIHDIRKVLKLLPERRQNLMFSATFSDEIRNLARGILHTPLEINVAPRNTAAETVRQQVIVVDKPAKPALLAHLIESHNLYQTLVFSRTKHGANKLVKHLDKHGIAAAAIHGNKSQNHRTRVLSQFKNGELQVLVATDIAARGIDIDQLPHVINYDLPQVAEDYVHRIGRTGRAGSEGEALSLVCAEEAYMLRTIERVIGKSIPHLQVEGFEASEPLPANPKPVKQGKGGNRSPQGNSRGPSNNNQGQRRRSRGRSRNNERSRQGAQQHSRG